MTDTRDPRSSRDLVAEMSLEEKASLLSGADFWNTKGVERLGIEPFTLTDGPHGLRKQVSDADHLGLNESLPATCFPSGVGLGASWDTDLAREVGAALGREARAAQVGVLLGPAVNIKRHPLGGRGFEYLSEDPELTGRLASAYIDGVQSEGVGTSLKHFAANNQERNRLLVDVIVDERTLREIYLRGFEIAVTQSQPWTVMSAYNRLNGTYASDDPWLLREILRGEWGHEGIVVSDWGGEDDRPSGVAAGMSLEMPGNGGITDADVVLAVREGRLDEADVDREAVRVVDLHRRVASLRDDDATFDADAHHALARRAALSAAVLLKNEGALPVARGARIAVLGAFAETPRYQGGGSSHIRPTRLVGLLDALREEHPDVAVEYRPGYRRDAQEPDQALLAEAGDAAAAADVVIVMAGLGDQEESEGYDREHLRLSDAHRALIETAVAANPATVVVLSNGAPVEMPWAPLVPAILEAHLGGQAGGAALADILLGDEEPAGRLAETFPQRIEDAPAHLHYPGTQRRVEYREGVFVGYRHYDTARVEPLFPFGHGLGYTSFALRDARTRQDAPGGPAATVSVVVENVGDRAGSTVVQAYVHQRGAQPGRPDQELKAFARVSLAPGESRRIALDLDRRAFARWGENAGDWVVDDADFEVRLGVSSRDIAAAAELRVAGTGDPAPSAGQNTALGDLLDHPVLGAWARGLRDTFVAGQGTYDADSPEFRMVEAFSRELPLRALVRIGALITQDELVRVLRVLDGTASEADVAAFAVGAES